MAGIIPGSERHWQLPCEQDVPPVVCLLDEGGLLSSIHSGFPGAAKLEFVVGTGRDLARNVGSPCLCLRARSSRLSSLGSTSGSRAWGS